MISIIAKVIIEMRALWLVGDYNTEALVFQMATTQFLHVFEEETNKLKENAISLIITWAIILKQLLFCSGSVNIVE